jgi:hypothetical protein
MTAVLYGFGLNLENWCLKKEYEGSKVLNVHGDPLLQTFLSDALHIEVTNHGLLPMCHMVGACAMLILFRGDNRSKDSLLSVLSDMRCLARVLAEKWMA